MEIMQGIIVEIKIQEYFMQKEPTAYELWLEAW